MGAGAFRADVGVACGVPGVEGLGAVAVGAQEGAAGGTEHAGGQAQALAEGGDGPVVDVVVVEQALAVVGAQGGDVEAGPGEQVVAVLEDEVAVGGVDEDLLAAAALAGGDGGLAAVGVEVGEGAQAQVVAGDDGDHVYVSLKSFQGCPDAASICLGGVN